MVAAERSRPGMLPSLAGLADCPVPTGMTQDDGNDAPRTLQELLAVEPGLIDLILAAGAANKAPEDPAVLTTCRAVQAWLGTHRQGRSRQHELVLWRTLAETVFPDAPVPPEFPKNRTHWGMGNWRMLFQEMCRRVERYQRARATHERVAAEAYEAQQDLHEAERAVQDDLKRVRRLQARRVDGALPDEELARQFRIRRRMANEKRTSEETALITMNEERRFLTEWDPFPPVYPPVG